MTDIPDEWVEKAAVAICRTEDLPPGWWRNHAEQAHAAIAAVAPDIRAQALRDAADAFDRSWNRGHDNSVHPNSWMLRDRAEVTP